MHQGPCKNNNSGQQLHIVVQCSLLWHKTENTLLMTVSIWQNPDQERTNQNDWICLKTTLPYNKNNNLTLSEIRVIFHVLFLINVVDIPGFQRQRVWQAMWQLLARHLTSLMPTMMKGLTGMHCKQMLCIWLAVFSLA